MMEIKEKKSDTLVVRMYLAAAGVGALLGGVYGVTSDFSPTAGPVKDAISGASSIGVLSGLFGAVVANCFVYEGEPMERFAAPENTVDALIDNTLEFFRADIS